MSHYSLIYRYNHMANGNIGKAITSEIDSLIESHQKEDITITSIRKFLSHAGIIDPFTKKLKFLDPKHSEFKKSMRLLDNDCGLKQSIRIGIIYVERGQFNQKQIMKNSIG